MMPPTYTYEMQMKTGDLIIIEEAEIATIEQNCFLIKTGLTTYMFPTGHVVWWSKTEEE